MLTLQQPKYASISELQSNWQKYIEKINLTLCCANKQFSDMSIVATSTDLQIKVRYNKWKGELQRSKD